MRCDMIKESYLLFGMRIYMYEKWVEESFDCHANVFVCGFFGKFMSEK